MWGLLFGLLLVFLAKGTNATVMKQVETRQGSGIFSSLTFTMLFSLSQAVFILLVPPYAPMRFSLDTLLYPGAYGSLYIIGYILLMKAYSEGPVSMTNAVWSFNTVVVIAYGLLFWDETLSLTQIIGLLLFFTGLFFYANSSYSTEQVKRKVTVKWLALTVSSTLIMGAATTFTKLFMLKHPDLGREYLFCYPLIACSLSAILCLSMNAKGTFRAVKDKKLWLYTALAGLTSVVWNTVYVKYLAVYPSAVFLPMFSVTAMLGTLTFGIVVMRERFSKNAVIASALLLTSILLLNL